MRSTAAGPAIIARMLRMDGQPCDSSVGPRSSPGQSEMEQYKSEFHYRRYNRASHALQLSISDVPHALLRAASRLFSTLGLN
jgi:hypothetical protein